MTDDIEVAIPDDLSLTDADVNAADVDMVLAALRRRFAEWIFGEIVSILHREGVPPERIADMAPRAVVKACCLYNARLEEDAAALARGYSDATLH